MPQGAVGGRDPNPNQPSSGRAAYRGQGREHGRTEAPEPPVEQMGAMRLEENGAAANQNEERQVVYRRVPESPYTEPRAMRLEENGAAANQNEERQIVYRRVPERPFREPGDNKIGNFSVIFFGLVGALCVGPWSTAKVVLENRILHGIVVMSVAL